MGESESVNVSCTDSLKARVFPNYPVAQEIGWPKTEEVKNSLTSCYDFWEVWRSVIHMFKFDIS